MPKRLPSCGWGRAFAAFLLAGLSWMSMVAQPSAEELFGRRRPDPLSDPFVEHCFMQALPGHNPKTDPRTTLVEEARLLLEFSDVLDAVAVCRAAGSLYPEAQKLQLANVNAAKSMSLLLFGLGHSRSPAAEVAVALSMAQKATDDRLMRPIYTFFLGSGYEYGIGTNVDMRLAVDWYRKSSELGERVSMRELARILIQGKGVPSDLPEAARLLLLAVKAGDKALLAWLTSGAGEAFEHTMRVALQRELARQGQFTGEPTGTFDAQTISAIASLARRK